jgi:uncharacterized protein YecE (DUF72 family)
MPNKTAIPGLFIGTSGWSYKHWSGIFYPQEIKPGRYLEHYITQFNCVELNASFYNLPRKSTVRGWVERTPGDFYFCPKLSRFITHQKRLADSRDALERFFDVFQVMERRLGPVLIQLPPGMKYERSLMLDFLDILKENHGQYRFAIEIRHPSWIVDDFLQLLEQYGIAFVIAHSGRRFPYHEAVTTDLVYLRFHGPETLYASNYERSDLLAYAEKIMHWSQEGHQVWIFFNNDFGGLAVKNARELLTLLSNI